MRWAVGPVIGGKKPVTVGNVTVLQVAIKACEVKRPLVAGRTCCDLVTAEARFVEDNAGALAFR